MLEPSENSVLILDPNSEARNTVAKFLSTKYACHQASTIAEATEMVSNTDFSAVVIDHADQENFDFLSTAQFLSPGSALVLTTSEESSRFVIEAFRAGASDVLLKPFDLEELEDAVVRAVGAWEAKRSQTKYYKSLEELVEEGAAELELSLDRLESS